MSEEIHAGGERLTRLRNKLAAREGLAGYEKNCEALRAEIARLEQSTLRPTNFTTSEETPEASSGERGEPVKSD
jgi:hypothetical protein